MLLEQPDQITLWFIGEVIGLGQEPRLWSDRYSSWQTVEYRVSEVLKGEVFSEKLAVEHGVVRSRATARTEHPGLSPEAFRPGTRWIVGAQDRDGILHALHEAPWTPNSEAEVRASLRPDPPAE